MTAKNVLYAATVSLPLLLLSCATDAYDKGDGKYSMLCAELVEAHANSALQIDFVKTDEGELLNLTKPLQASWIKTPDSLYRALLYYNKVEEGAEPVNITKVPILLPHRIDTLRTDPVNLESVWVSTSRRYLNMGIYLMVGATDRDDQLQLIGLNRDTLITHPDDKRTLHLQLFHDQGDVPEYYSQRFFLSIPTDSIAADTVCLRINTYNGLIEKQFILSSTQ